MIHFPEADIVLNAWHLVALGLAVGICGGFWGVGGGWITTPALYAMGVPINVAVGTDLAHTLGKSIVSTFRHARFGNVSWKLALVMSPAVVLGVEGGVRLMEFFKAHEEWRLESVLTAAYLVVLLFVALFTLTEARRAARGGHSVTGHSGSRVIEDQVSADFSMRLRSLSLPPYVTCPVAGVQRLSVWFFSGLSALTGVIAGLLGGGAFLRLPMLVYLVGVPTHVAIGTNLCTIAVQGAYGTMSHGMRGNVDFLMALFLLIGATVGAQIGTFATRYATGMQVRALFGVGAILAASSLVTKTYLSLDTAALVMIIGTAAVSSLLITAILVRGVRAAHRAA